MKSLIKGVVAGLALSVALSGIASAQTIRMGTEGAYPPYNFINDAGEIDGFERELGDELLRAPRRARARVQGDHALRRQGRPGV